MTAVPWLIISIVMLALIVGIGVVFILIRRKRGVEIGGKEYKSFFYIGIGYLVVGIVLGFVFPQDVTYFNFFTIMGILFAAMGLGNIEKWRKKRD